MKTLSEQELLEMWLVIGANNYWIRQTSDPAFDKSMLINCHTLEILENFFRAGNWCLGQGFYYRNLCFINQINSGDEWLTIKDNYAFESISFLPCIKQGRFYDLMERLLKASEQDCKNLNY